jgi:hypothetical protein
MEPTECSESRLLIFKLRGNTQKKIYLIYNTEKVGKLGISLPFFLCFLKGIKILLPFYVTFIADRHVSKTHGNTYVVQQELGVVLEAINCGLNR